jgi:hypothetical protein
VLQTSGNSKAGSQDSVEYLTKGWFPVNTALLKEVQANLKVGKYNEDREALIRDIKADFSLFAHCLKGLGKTTNREQRDQNPLDIIRMMEIENLKKMIEVSPDGISAHVFDPKLKAQISRIKHFLITCSTAEAICESKNLDSDLAFSCAVARQLGMTLVAYNYPRIYSQAVASLKDEHDDLEKILKKTLGYSPAQIGARIALGWNQNTALKIGLGEAVIPPEDEDPLIAYKSRNAEHKQGEELKKICEIGESLARLNDVEHYPSSAKKWDVVMSEVKNYLGPDGLDIINERVRAYQTDYVALAPDAFATEVSPERNVKTANAQHAVKLFAENPFIKNCHSNLKGEFEKVYKKIMVGQVSTEGVNILISNVIPLAGFARGCIYLADMKRMRLVPTLRIGNVDLSEFRVLNYADSGSNLHPVIDALNATSPLRQENVMVNGEVVSHISGNFGNHEKNGVLHLQMGRELLAADRNVSLMYFKAVRQALNDCLNLH